jgi:cell division protein FtsI/penicillin-binding protein 2
MNPNLNVTIRRLTSAFIVLFLIISGIAAYVQIGNQAFYNGPVLAHGDYDTNPDRNCAPYGTPVRGNIYDRNGVKLAWSVPDPNDPCIYDRKYDPRVYTSGLAPLLGYDSQQYGTAGLEKTYNDQLAGVNSGQSVSDVVNSLLHKARYGQDIYLTIDINLQVQAANNFRDQNYQAHTVAYNPSPGNGPCQDPGTDPPGSLTAIDPHTGEILAMVSWPSFDPNKIDDSGYFQSLNADPGHPLLNHATQGLYAPGSTFKTITLLAALDSGSAKLSDQFTRDEAVSFHVPQGETIQWNDFLAPNPYPAGLQFPINLDNAYAYSDNVVFAREALQMGGATWLKYVGRFGIQEPGNDIAPVPFDGPYAQSGAYNDTNDQQAILGNQDLLAESGFGQGHLLITPLTMTEVAASIAADGNLYEPHAVLKTIIHNNSGTTENDIQPTLYSGGPIFSPDTAKTVRTAMWSVTNYGTASTVGNPDPNAGYHKLADSPVPEGGKTGTAQGDQANPETWWISMAPIDTAPNGGTAQMAMTVMKEHAGEGACQVFVADHTYVYASQNHIIPVNNP